MRVQERLKTQSSHGHRSLPRALRYGNCRCPGTVTANSLSVGIWTPSCKRFARSAFNTLLIRTTSLSRHCFLSILCHTHNLLTFTTATCVMPNPSLLTRAGRRVKAVCSVGLASKSQVSSFWPNRAHVWCHVWDEDVRNATKCIHVLMFECLHAMCNRVCLVVDGAAHDRDRDDAHPPHLATATSHAYPLISSLPTGTQNGRIGGAQITSVKSNGYGSSRPSCTTHRMQPSMNPPADEGTSHSSHCRTVNRIATIHEPSCR